LSNAQKNKGTQASEHKKEGYEGRKHTCISLSSYNGDIRSDHPF